MNAFAFRRVYIAFLSSIWEIGKCFVKDNAENPINVNRSERNEEKKTQHTANIGAIDRCLGVDLKMPPFWCLFIYSSIVVANNKPSNDTCTQRLT